MYLPSRVLTTPSTRKTDRALTSVSGAAHACRADVMLSTAAAAADALRPSATGGLVMRHSPVIGFLGAGRWQSSAGGQRELSSGIFILNARTFPIQGPHSHHLVLAVDGEGDRELPAGSGSTDSFRSYSSVDPDEGGQGPGGMLVVDATDDGTEDVDVVSIMTTGDGVGGVCGVMPRSTMLSMLPSGVVARNARPTALPRRPQPVM